MNAQPQSSDTRMPATRSLKALLECLVEVSPSDERDIKGISLDSRQVGKDDLFIAVPGNTCDGRDFIQQAVQNGAAAVAHDGKKDEVDVKQHALYASTAARRVPDFAIHALKKYIGGIADRFYGSPSSRMLVIGITGTNGKTTCAYLITQALNLLGKRCALMSTIGSGFIDANQANAFHESGHEIKEGKFQPAGLTTADAITTHRRLAELLAARAEAVCVEVSSHGLIQGRVNQVAFDVALFTNLSRDHLDYHRDMKRYANAKRKLFNFFGLRSIVLNVDDPFGCELLDERMVNEAVTYGFEMGDLRAKKLKLDGDGIVMEMEYHGQTAVVQSPLIGEINARNLLSAIATLIACGYDLKAIAAALSECRPPAGRMEVIHSNRAQPVVVVDYAHTPEALQQALRSLRELGDGNLWVVFGCGGNRDRGKRAQMGTVALRFADRIIITDDNPRDEKPAYIVAQIMRGMPKDITTGMSPKVTINHDRRRAIQIAIATADANDIVLIAGKGHETTQTIGRKIYPLSDGEMATAVLKSASPYSSPDKSRGVS